MSEHLCPNCKQKAFTWYMGDDDRTWWRCSLCEFHIEEDESKEKQCEKCKLPFPSVSWLMDKEQSYFWCLFCGNKTESQNN
jgi:hypothetical protein